jgi:hypothetical protein
MPISNSHSKRCNNLILVLQVLHNVVFTEAAKTFIFDFVTGFSELQWLDWKYHFLDVIKIARVYARYAIDNHIGLSGSTVHINIEAIRAIYAGYITQNYAENIGDHSYRFVVDIRNMASAADFPEL